jgi:thymidylate kinase
VFEGNDRAGKSTTLQLTKTELEAQGVSKLGRQSQNIPLLCIWLDLSPPFWYEVRLV